MRESWKESERREEIKGKREGQGEEREIERKEDKDVKNDEK